MISSPKITTAQDIALISLQNCPSDMTFIADIFTRIGKIGIDVDMISLAPAQGAFTSVSFSIMDSDLEKMFSFTSELRQNTKLKAVVSSGNCKISVYDKGMVTSPGTAAQVFEAAAKANVDIRLITTSEVDISLLVTAADFNNTLQALKASFNQA